MKITASIEIDTRDPESIEDIIDELQEMINFLQEVVDRETKNKEGGHDN
jgi:hypothetical protein